MSAPTEPPKPRRRRATFWAGFLACCFVAWAALFLILAAPRTPDWARTRASVEIKEIDAAVSAFKAKLNAPYLPAGFRLKASYDPADPEAAYLRQPFPQLDLADTGLPPGTDDQLDSNQALVFFLSGGRYTGYDGFSLDKKHPFRSSGGLGTRYGEFFAVSPKRVYKDGHLRDPWGTPYAYLAFDPTIGAYPDRDCFGVRPYRLNGEAMNPKGWQIVSAGPDRRFGPGGDWTTGGWPWPFDGPGADDLSNFNTGPLSVRRD